MLSLPPAPRLFVCHDYGPGGTLRTARDATLGMPVLIVPSLQVNIKAGALPEPEGNGVRYLRVPLDSL